MKAIINFINHKERNQNLWKKTLFMTKNKTIRDA